MIGALGTQDGHQTRFTNALDYPQLSHEREG
jgi:hypothetical protein